jgi:hypothetical protein
MLHYCIAKTASLYLYISIIPFTQQSQNLSPPPLFSLQVKFKSYFFFNETKAFN